MKSKRITLLAILVIVGLFFSYSGTPLTAGISPDNEEFIDFVYTDKMSFREIDYNSDGLRDILEIKFEIEVVVPGMLDHQECTPPLTYWNSSGFVDESYRSCSIGGKRDKIVLPETGLTNITFRISYGAIIHKHFDMEFLNVSFTPELIPYNSTFDLNQPKAPTAPTFNFTISDLSTVSTEIGTKTVESMSETTILDNIGNSRSIGDTFNWSQYLEFKNVQYPREFHVIGIDQIFLLQNGSFEIELDDLSTEYPRINTTTPTEDGSYVQNTTYLYFNEWHNHGSFLIPAALDTDILKTYLTEVYFTIHDHYLDTYEDWEVNRYLFESDTYLGYNASIHLYLPDIEYYYQVNSSLVYNKAEGSMAYSNFYYYTNNSGSISSSYYEINSNAPHKFTGLTDTTVISTETTTSSSSSETQSTSSDTTSTSATSSTSDSTSSTTSSSSDTTSESTIDRTTTTDTPIKAYLILSGFIMIVSFHRYLKRKY